MDYLPGIQEGRNEPIKDLEDTGLWSNGDGCGKRSRPGFQRGSVSRSHTGGDFFRGLLR